MQTLSMTDSINLDIDPSENANSPAKQYSNISVTSFWHYKIIISGTIEFFYEMKKKFKITTLFQIVILPNDQS